MFGIIGMIVFGILEFALQPGTPWVEFFAFAFGSGAALTLDEFALILHLEDVYWTGEGRASIDAVILGVTFITLLLTGLRRAPSAEVGDMVEMSRWVGSALILSSGAFVDRQLPQGQAVHGDGGHLRVPVAVIGAVRLAKPGSPWAHSRYARQSRPSSRGRAAATRASTGAGGERKHCRVGRHRRQAAPALFRTAAGVKRPRRRRARRVLRSEGLRRAPRPRRGVWAAVRLLRPLSAAVRRAWQAIAAARRRAPSRGLSRRRG